MSHAWEWKQYSVPVPVTFDIKKVLTSERALARAIQSEMVRMEWCVIFSLHDLSPYYERDLLPTPRPARKSWLAMVRAAFH